ncbi:MAG: regulator, partial [Gammaproteobacteria bacterium]
GGGAILGGLVLCSIAVCVIERQLVKATVFALVGALLTFFGFMHGEAIGVAQSPVVAASYLLFAGVLFGCAKYAHVSEIQEYQEEILEAEMASESLT